jgi:hypothetical protein
MNGSIFSTSKLEPVPFPDWRLSSISQIDHRRPRLRPLPAWPSLAEATWNSLDVFAAASFPAPLLRPRAPVQASGLRVGRGAETPEKCIFKLYFSFLIKSWLHAQHRLNSIYNFAIPWVIVLATLRGGRRKGKIETSHLQ